MSAWRSGTRSSALVLDAGEPADGKVSKGPSDAVDEEDAVDDDREREANKLAEV
jgi:hypothetical protein